MPAVGLADRHGVAGSFFTGLLAVLVATPCTAPFMGVAVAAGLAAPAAGDRAGVRGDGPGLGRALCRPGLDARALARLMPRPGRWMEMLKQALAFPMYGGGGVAGLGGQPGGRTERRARRRWPGWC